MTKVLIEECFKFSEEINFPRITVLTIATRASLCGAILASPAKHLETKLNDKTIFSEATWCQYIPVHITTFRVTVQIILFSASKNNFLY